MALKSFFVSRQREVQAIRDQDDHNMDCADCVRNISAFVCTDYSIFVCRSCADIHSKLKHEVKNMESGNFTEKDIEILKLGGNKSVNDKYLAIHDDTQNIVNKTLNMEQYIQNKYIDRAWFKLTKDESSTSTSSQKANKNKNNYGAMIFSGDLLKPSENKNKTIWSKNFAVILSDKTLRFYDGTYSLSDISKLKLDLNKIKYITKTPAPKIEGYGHALFFYVSESITDPYGYQFGCTNKYQYKRWISNIQTIINQNKRNYSLFKNELLIHGFCRIYSEDQYYFPMDILSLITVWFKGGWDLFNAHKFVEVGAFSIKRVKKPDAKMINVFSAESIGFGEKKIWKLKFEANDPNKKGNISSAQIGIIDCNKAKPKMNDSFANKMNGGYAYGAWTGNIYHANIAPKKTKYGPSIKVHDIIEVELDMDCSDNNNDEGCTLSFRINGISKGIAFNKLNKTKQYKLAVALKWREHYSLID